MITLMLGAGFLTAMRDAPLAVPGGGAVRLPAPYKPKTPVKVETLLAGYRRYRSTMAGSYECDGMVAVGAPKNFATLKDFVSTGRGALTTQWAFANESGGRWYGKPDETFEEIESEGPNGIERRGPLIVRTVGWTVKDNPARLYAVNDRRGVMVGVWIFDKHGGEKQAMRMAEAIAASHQAAAP